MQHPKTPISKRFYHNKCKRYPSPVLTASLNRVASIDGYGGRSTEASDRPYTYRRRPANCQVCKEDLLEEEFDFYPCNCKYQVRCPTHLTAPKQICHECYYYYVEEGNRRCPNCENLYEVSRIKDQIKNPPRSVKQVPRNNDVTTLTVPQLRLQTQSSSGVSSYSQQVNIKPKNKKAQQPSFQKSPPQKRTSSDNNRQAQPQKLSQVRILQRNTVYLIGVSPSIAKEETLRKAEYFGQYGRIQQITINKQNIYQTENQGPCFSAYITYSNEGEASLAILAIDQFIYDGRLMRASFGRTKYCRFFLKTTQCLNKECPYQHFYSENKDILTQDDMQKKELFQECQQLAFQLSRIGEIPEDEFKMQLKAFKNQFFPNAKGSPTMPAPESIYDKKQIFKLYGKLDKSGSSVRKVKKLTQDQTSTNEFDVYNSKQLYDNQGRRPRTDKSAKKSPASNSQLDCKYKTYFDKVSLGYINDDSGQKAKTSSNEITQDTSQKLRKQRRNSSGARLTVGEDNSIVSKQLTSNLEKQLAASKDDQVQDAISTEQTNSILNDKKTSRFLSLKEEQEDSNLLKESILLTQRSSNGGKGLQKQSSLQSLIVESLKFLNEETDTPQNQTLFQANSRTNPPSEAHPTMHDSTLAPSNLGGVAEEEYFWNYNQSNKNQKAQRMTTACNDGISCFSGSDTYNRKNMSQLYKRNSLYTTSNYLIPTQDLKPNQSSVTFNDPHPLNPNIFQVRTNVNGGLSCFNQSQSNVSRKTTACNQLNFNANNSIAGDNGHPQLTRSPSHPDYENLFTPLGVSKIYETEKQNSIQQSRQMHLNSLSPGVTQHFENGLQTSRYGKQQQYALNQYNLERFNQQYEAGKDLLYAKIFLQDEGQSASNLISSQSLFCYTPAFDGDVQENKVLQTPTQEKIGVNSFLDNQETNRTQPKNYYKEFLNVKEGFFNGNFQLKRRNSMDQGREGLQPQHLQFLSPMKGSEEFKQEEDAIKLNQQGKPRSKSRH